MGSGKAAPPKQPAGGPAAPIKTFKYGMPLYGLAWPEGETFYTCGGGGHGIKNRLVCAEAKDGSLSDQTAEHLFGSVCPSRWVRCLALRTARHAARSWLGRGNRLQPCCTPLLLRDTPAACHTLADTHHHRSGTSHATITQRPSASHCRLAIAPGGRSIVFGVGDAGLRRLDLDTRGRVPKFTEVTGEGLAGCERGVKACVRVRLVHTTSVCARVRLQACVCVCVRACACVCGLGGTRWPL
mgnify:CR=1 FL=1